MYPCHSVPSSRQVNLLMTKYMIRDNTLHIRNTNNQISKSNITFITIQKSICACSRVFCSVIVCLNICVCAYLLQNNIRMYNQINIHRSEVYCGSAFEPGSSGLPYYCTPPVCVPAVLGALTVWRKNNKMTKIMDLLSCLFPISMKKNGKRSGDNTNPKIIHTQPTYNRTLSPFTRDLTGTPIISHTTPLHATTLHYALTSSTRHVSKLCKIVFYEPDLPECRIFRLLRSKF